MQGKNGGTLLDGGKPGNKGGSGRPSSQFREDCKRITSETLPVIERIIKGTAQRGEHKPSFADSRGAWKDVAMIGWGEAVYMLEDTQLLNAVVKILPNHMADAEACQAFLAELRAELGTPS